MGEKTMNKNKKSPEVFLKSIAALMIWKNEVIGQISDGEWENSRPSDHWKFWCNAEAKLGEQVGYRKNESENVCLKSNYNVRALASNKVLLDRMLHLVRFSKSRFYCKELIDFAGNMYGYYADHPEKLGAFRNVSPASFEKRLNEKIELMKGNKESIMSEMRKRLNDVDYTAWGAGDFMDMEKLFDELLQAKRRQEQDSFDKSKGMADEQKEELLANGITIENFKECCEEIAKIPASKKEVLAALDEIKVMLAQELD